MFIYLFLLAAAASTELPDINLTPTEEREFSSFAKAMEDTQEFQELIAVLTQEMQAGESAQEQAAEVALVTSPITITNAIEPSMLEYKHWTGKYSPEQFAISINGTEIETGKTCEIPANATTVEIGYTYSFMNGMKSGGRKISYQLNENISQANITFDWKNDWRIILDNGKAVKEIVS